MEGNFRIDDRGRAINVTDLGADLSNCMICGSEAVLMFNWCKTCRENYPEDFRNTNPSYYILLPEEKHESKTYPC